MVKIVLDLFDVLSPESRAALQQLIVDRFNSFAAKNPHCNEDLERFCRDSWKPEELTAETPASSSSGRSSPSPRATSAASSFSPSATAAATTMITNNNDRFALIRAFCTRGWAEGTFPTAKLARRAIYRVDFDQCSPPGSPSAATAPTSPEEQQQLLADAIEEAGSPENEVALDRLHLTSDAPIVRCLLGLSQLPDVVLWLLCYEPLAFAAQVLRRLPVAPFFEGASRLWRLLDATCDETGRMTSLDILRRKMNALAHEPVVRVTESRHDAQVASQQSCWVGVHLVLAHLNRAASVETFSLQRGTSPVSSVNSDNNNKVADGDDENSPIQQQQINNPASSHRYVTARGIAQLGRVIIQRVPELRDAFVAANASGTSALGLASPMLFRSQTASFAKKFCVCNCFWTGVAVGVGGSVAAMGGLAVLWIITTATLRTFGVKPRK